MTIINLNIDDVNLITCKYGTHDKNIDTSDILKKYINHKINKNIYFITININNKTMKSDPAPYMIKDLNLNFKNKNYNIKENDNVHFCIKLSFNIIFKNKINNSGLDNYNTAILLGKGPTFKDVIKEKNELRCAINQAANIANEVDLLCLNDHHNLFKINLDTLKNLKYILIPEYLHINQLSCKEGYFVNILDYLNNKFFGNLIIYNLITSRKNTKYIIDLETATSSGNNCFEFIGKFTNIKTVDTYGFAVFKKDEHYNKIFVGNGYYDNARIIILKKVLKKTADKYKITYNLN